MSDDSGPGAPKEYTVEIAVTGTWREYLLATSREEAAAFAEEHLEEHLNGGDWGDLGWEITGVSGGESDD